MGRECARWTASMALSVASRPFHTDVDTSLGPLTHRHLTTACGNTTVTPLTHGHFAAATTASTVSGGSRHDVTSPIKSTYCKKKIPEF
jgi:hypothetical protein